MVNANLGGAKSYFFIDQERKVVVEAPQDGQLRKTVELTYQNTRPADNCNLEAGQLCLNSTLRDWTRIYVPAGAELESAQGFLDEVETYEETINDDTFTVFEGYFTLEPNSVAKLRLTYTVPYQRDSYQLQLWKQGGIDPVPVLMEVTGGQEEVVLDADHIYQTRF